MKKNVMMFSTIIAMLLMLLMVESVWAEEPNFDNANEVWTDFETAHTYAEKTAELYHNFYGEDIIWAVYSLNNHQEVRTSFFQKWEFEEFQKLYNRVDVDFVQIGGFFKAISSDEVEHVQESFKKDTVTSALNCIMPVDSNPDVVRKNIEDRNLPIYWRVETTEWDATIYTVEVAIGKYEITNGDTLSSIAEKHNKTVDEILDWNRNITNPDVIYAGDFLVIK